MVLWLAIVAAAAVYLWMLRRARRVRRLTHEQSLGFESDYGQLVREHGVVRSDG